MYPRFYRRAFVIGTVVVLGYALLELLDTFWSPLAWAAVLAFLFHPLHERLTKRFKGRAGASAGLITGLTPIFVIAPLALLGIVFAKQVGALIEYLRGRSFMPYPTMLEKLEGYPVIGPAFSWIRENVTVSAEQIQGWLTQGVQSLLHSAATMGGGVVLGVVGSLVSFFLTLFLLFFLLRDGASMLNRLIALVPMEKRRRSQLANYLGDVTRAVVYGTAMTALIQGTLVGIGFAIAGLPSPVVFGVLGGLAAFIPAAGTGVVLVPAVIALAIMGRWGSAIFLGLWSLLVGFSDNFLRPLLAAQRADVSALAVFVGVIGGVTAFGFIGLIVGPVLLSLIVALLRFAEEELAKQG
jgi:predicted PurR-regulated permease PerM